ncbi:MAG: hypothetical protein QXJ07_05075 [Candidatus Bathyarchaeia archaeon]
MTKYSGKCSKCGKVHYSDRKGDIAICDCWRYCPLCGAEMTPHTPELTPDTYGLDGKRDFKILMVCNNTAEHPDNSPFYSTQKPVEVVCT